MLALTFPGQGSQRPQMGLPWTSDPGWELVQRGSSVLDTDLAWLLTEAPADRLKGPFEAQVATYLTSLLALDAFRRALPAATPVAVAGHSLGEFTALAAAGAVDPLAGLVLVGARGRAMAAAAQARPGVMSALLGVADEDVERACAKTEEAWPANYNAPGHVVVSGSAIGVAAAVELSGARRAVPLPVGGAYHTPFMEPARPALAVALAAAAPGRADVPVWSNVDAAGHQDGFAELVLTQLTAPVRWADTLRGLAAAGVTEVVELGPGGVLTGLARRTVPELAARSLATPQDLLG